MFIKNQQNHRGCLTPQSGASLIELVLFIVIVSTALASIVLVMNQVTKVGADPLSRKQALSVAYSLLEEVESKDFSPAMDASGVLCVNTQPVTNANRAAQLSNCVVPYYHLASDYNGFTMTGITSLAGSAVSGLENYTASVTVTGVASVWNGVPVSCTINGNTVTPCLNQIDVTVTGPNKVSITATGYRTAY
jgi:MSHA pilin protein MshD